MKRLVSIRVDVELSADTPAGIEDAAREAICALKVDLAMDRGGGEFFAAKSVEKKLLQQDEHRLWEIVLSVCKVSEKDFRKCKLWKSALARNLFSVFARNHLLWTWDRIANFVHRDRSTVISGARSAMEMISGVSTRRKGSYDKARGKRVDNARRVWSNLKVAWQMEKS